MPTRRRDARDPRFSGGRTRVVAGAAAIVVGLVACLALAALSMPPVTGAAAPGGVPDTGRSIIEVGSTAVVRPGSVVDHVYVIGADAVIGGVVLHDVVCIGGDVLLLPSAIVQQNVVCIGGAVNREQGAVVLGDTSVVSGGVLRSLAGWNPIRPVIDPFSGSALLGWLLSALVHVGLAAAVAAAAPRPVAALTARTRRHTWSSLGVGLGSALVVVPLVSVALLVSVVGAPLLVPWLLVIMPVALIASFVAVSAALGRSILTLTRRRDAGLVAEAAVGALVLSLARLIPYAGPAAWSIAWVIGFGAVSVSLVRWLRDRRARRRSPTDATTNPT